MRLPYMPTTRKDYRTFGRVIGRLEHARFIRRMDHEIERAKEETRLFVESFADNDDEADREQHDRIVALKRGGHL